MTVKGKTTSLRKNTVLNTVRILASVVFPLITFPYAARVLGSDNIGKVQFGLSIVTYFSLMSALGVTSYGTREGSAVRYNREAFSKLASEIFSINIFSSLISYLLLFALILLVPSFSSYRELIFIQSLSIIFNTVGVEWIFTAKENYLVITLRSIIAQILSLILLFLFVRTEGDYYIYAAITVFANAGVNLFNFFYSKRYCDIKLTMKLNIKKHLRPLLVLFVSGLAVQIYATSDITMLGLMKGDYEVGIYSVAAKVFSIIKSLLAAAITVSIPRFAYYYSRREENNFKELGGRLLRYCIILILPAIVGLLLLSDNAIMIVGGTEYMEGSLSLKILSFALIFSILSTLFGGGILISRKQERKFLFATILAAVINIGLNFVFIPLLAQNGAAFTTVIAELVVMTVNGFFAFRYCGRRGLFGTLLHAIVGCVGIGLVYYVIHSFFGVGYIVEAITVSTLGTIVYLIIMLLFKDEQVLEAVKNISLKMKRGKRKK